MECTKCRGDGGTYRPYGCKAIKFHPCPECNGSGQRKEEIENG